MIQNVHHCTKDCSITKLDCSQTIKGYSV